MRLDQLVACGEMARILMDGTREKRGYEGRVFPLGRMISFVVDSYGRRAVFDVVEDGNVYEWRSYPPPSMYRPPGGPVCEREVVTWLIRAMTNSASTYPLSDGPARAREAVAWLLGEVTT